MNTDTSRKRLTQRLGLPIAGLIAGLALAGIVGVMIVGAPRGASAQSGDAAKAPKGAVVEKADDATRRFVACLEEVGVDMEAFDAARKAAGILGIILQNDELEASFISKTIEYIDNFPIDKERTKDRYSEEQERFETCLTDSGVDLEAIGAARKAGTLTDEQMAAVESCKSAFDGDSHRENGVRKDDLTSDARTKLLQFRAKLGEQIRSGELTQDEAEAVWESAFEEKVYGNK